MEPKVYKIEDGKYSVQAVVYTCGEDLSVTICGGTKPHVGAAALGVPYPSLTGDGTVSASVSVLCAAGHKEDELVRETAKQLASRFCCNVAVSAGIHIENASAQDIQRIWKNCMALLEFCY